MIYQVYGYLYYGDGVSNVIGNISLCLEKHGIKSIIAVQGKDVRCNNKNILIWRELDDIKIQPNDVVLYHLANGNHLNYLVESLVCKKILIYHNITPAHFFRGVDINTYLNCSSAILDVKYTVGNYLRAITLSEFSKKELISAGWDAKNVISIPLAYSTKVGNNNNYIKQNKQDGTVRFLFVGRISPNKKIEDVIRIFSYYQHNYNSNCELTLIGNIQFGLYYNALLNYAESLETKGIRFRDFVSDAELKRLYSEADLFLCMSEHEGFCIPLVEAMSYEIPVVAFSGSAVKDTMANAGVLIEKKDDERIGRIINRIIEDKKYRSEIVKNQSQRLLELDLNRENNIYRLLEIINEVALLKEFHYASENDEFRRLLSNCEIVSIKKNLLHLCKMYGLQGGLIIIGMGKAGKTLYDELVLESIKPAFLCDNDESIKEYKGECVYGVAECAKFNKNSIFIITPQKYRDELKQELILYGVDEDRILMFNSNSRVIYK